MINYSRIFITITFFFFLFSGNLLSQNNLWSFHGAPPADVTDIAYHQGKLYAGTHYGLYISEDEGINWLFVDDIGSEKIDRIHIDPKENIWVQYTKLFYDGGINTHTNNYIWKSSNNGLSFFKVDERRIGIQVVAGGSSFSPIDFMSLSTGFIAEIGSFSGSVSNSDGWKAIFSPHGDFWEESFFHSHNQQISGYLHPLVLQDSIFWMNANGVGRSSKSNPLAIQINPNGAKLGFPVKKPTSYNNYIVSSKISSGALLVTVDFGITWIQEDVSAITGIIHSFSKNGAQTIVNADKGIFQLDFNGQNFQLTPIWNATPVFNGITKSIFVGNKIFMLAKDQLFSYEINTNDFKSLGMTSQEGGQFWQVSNDFYLFNKQSYTYRSADGKSWDYWKIPKTNNGKTLSGFFANTDSTILAISENTIYISKDDAISFSKLDSISVHFYSLLKNQENSTLYLAGTSFYSRDNGFTWQNITEGAVQQALGDTLVNGNMVSLDHGKSWTEIQTPVSISPNRSLLLTPNSILFANGGTIYQSLDLGVTWTSFLLSPWIQYGEPRFNLLKGGDLIFSYADELFLKRRNQTDFFKIPSSFGNYLNWHIPLPLKDFGNIVETDSFVLARGNGIWAMPKCFLEPINFEKIDTALCLDRTFELNGQEFKYSGQYSLVFPNDSCFKHIQLNLSFQDISTMIEIDTIVNSGSLVFDMVINQDTSFSFISDATIGCDTTLQINVFITSQINETEDIESLQLYPNPTQNKIQVNWKTGEAKLSLFDTKGRILLEKMGFSGLELDLSPFSDGVYFLKIDLGSDGVFFRKVVVQR